MRAKLFFALLAAGLLGFFCGELISDSLKCRQQIAQWCGREWNVDAVVRFRARKEKVSPAQVEQEYQLLRAQMANAKNWEAALKANGLCPWLLRRELAENLRAQQWLDRQVKSAISVNESDCRQYFDANRADFVQPKCFRALHLFLAAPPETAPEIVETKRRTIEELSKRMKNGEKLADLAAAFSEDEATKKRGGDLNYFSEARMPADFMSAIERLRVGETSGVFQTKLGFHIAQLTEVTEARELTFTEAQPDIAARLENIQRGAALENLLLDLRKDALALR